MIYFQSFSIKTSNFLLAVVKFEIVNINDRYLVLKMPKLVDSHTIFRLECGT